MKLLLITENRQIADKLQPLSNHSRFNMIYYNDPIKALDNFKEIDPDVVMFNTIDFPRHWKPAARFLRNDKSRKDGLIFLITDGNINEDELVKVAQLEINAMIDISELDENLDRIKKLVNRYKSTQEDKTGLRFILSDDRRLKFLFLNPDNYNMVSGSIVELSPYQGCFKPDDPSVTASLTEGTLLKECSMKISDRLVTLDSQILHNNGLLELKFNHTKQESQELLTKYFSEIA